uniref:Uncharacterized protein n=1 Tax=Lepeophtheirus salmonis TaxID=72036 RepID=A0A0K2UBH8_LEPSM
MLKDDQTALWTARLVLYFELLIWQRNNNNKTIISVVHNQIPSFSANMFCSNKASGPFYR